MKLRWFWVAWYALLASPYLVARQVRRVVCRVRGHRWDEQHLRDVVCSRCRVCKPRDGALVLPMRRLP